MPWPSAPRPRRGDDMSRGARSIGCPADPLASDRLGIDGIVSARRPQRGRGASTRAARLLAGN